MDDIKMSWYMGLDLSLVLLSVGVLIHANKSMSLFLSLS